MKSPFSKMTVLKLPSAKRFEYMPRNYNPEKERLDKRKKRIAEQLGLDDKIELDRREINFRAKLSESRIHRERNKANIWSNIRLIIILGILLTVCYFIYINLEDVIASLIK